MSDVNSTIKFCKKCQAETERYTNGKCKSCARVRAAKWANDNPEKKRLKNASYHYANYEKIKATKSVYYASNIEKILAYAAAQRIANPEKMKAKNSAYYAANSSRAKSIAAAYYAKNSAKVNARNSVWRAMNPDARRIMGQNRRSRKRMNGGILSRGLAKKLFTLQKGKCPCCGQSLGDNYHLDHIIPLALGGSNADDNIQLLRSICNLQKHAKHPIDFMQGNGYLL